MRERGVVIEQSSCDVEARTFVRCETSAAMLPPLGKEDKSQPG